jgi:glycosyltransferase involved in cell wall biosynthesis
MSHVTAQPDVSVVIPTHSRPVLLTRAVESALRQTLENVEVIVIVDGRDQESQAVLARAGDARVRVHVPPRSLGSGARPTSPWVDSGG